MLQEELAQELGISRSAVSHLENGRHEPGLDMLEKLADLFDVSIDYLVGRSNMRKLPENTGLKKTKAEAAVRELEYFQEGSKKAVEKIKELISGI